MLVEVSVGEVVDKVTILDIKREKVKAQDKLVNIRKEFDLLYKKMQTIGLSDDSEFYQQLKTINLKLWHIEDDIRIKEAKAEFDQEFIELARSVYFVNDERASVKKNINVQFGSDLVEEKEYVDYQCA